MHPCYGGEALPSAAKRGARVGTPHGRVTDYRHRLRRPRDGTQEGCEGHRPSGLRPQDRCYHTRMQSLRRQSTDQTCRGEFRRARLPQLVGWPTGGPPRASPTAGVVTNRNACAGEQRGMRTPQEPTDTESAAAEVGRRGRMRESASPRERGAPQRRVEPLRARRSRRR